MGILRVNNFRISENIFYQHTREAFKKTMAERIADQEYNTRMIKTMGGRVNATYSGYTAPQEDFLGKLVDVLA